MPPDALIGTIEHLRTENEISPDVECLRDEILIIGLRQSFKNLETPNADGGPMDHPTKALAVVTGPDCKKVSPGTLVFFTKFGAVEIDYAGRRLFIVKEADVRMVKPSTPEEIEQLVKNVY